MSLLVTDSNWSVGRRNLKLFVANQDVLYFGDPRPAHRARAVSALQDSVAPCDGVISQKPVVRVGSSSFL